MAHQKHPTSHQPPLPDGDYHMISEQPSPSIHALHEADSAAARRKIHLIALFFCVLAALLIWALRSASGQLDPFSAIFLPAAAGWYTILALLLWVNRRFLYAVEIAIYVSAASIMIAWFYYTLHASYTIFDLPTELAGMSWFLLIYVLAFAIFPGRYGLFWAGSIYILLIAIGALSIGSRVLAGEMRSELYVLAHFYLSNGAIILLLLMFTRIKEQYLRARLLADAMALLATTDPLTGLYNRRQFLSTLNYEIEKVRRYNRPLSLIMFDLDHFKLINDSYGHTAGDQVLQEVARRVQQTLRTTDIIGRWGGEEFVVLMPETTLRQAKLAAEQLRQAIAKQPIGQFGTITISLGVTACACQDTANALLERADSALYQAKENGRNCVAEG